MDTPTSAQTAAVTATPTSAASTPTGGPWAINVSPVGSPSVPIGSSTTFAVELAPHADQVVWKAENLPPGITTRFLGDPAPYGNTLVVTSAQTSVPGAYTVTLNAYQQDASQQLSLLASAPVTVTLSVCVESQSGGFTQSIKANAATIISAGKPNKETGLIVPVQICQSSHIQVTLNQVLSETGAVLTAPPPFYLYRSIVYPAPGMVQAAPGRYWCLNVELPRVNNTDWHLDADAAPGLYLLIFQSDAYPGNPDPSTRPDMVTYDLQIGP